jgi:hypothetical protein
MIRATLDTKNFHFEAYGEDYAAACAVLIDGLNRHAIAYQLPADWFSPEDIEHFEIQIGRAYRDSEIIK